jgi:thiol:disulfide interchange protein DsbD
MKSLLFSLLVTCSYVLTAQQQDPLSWSAKYEAVNDKEGKIVVTAIIQKGWHTYSQRETDAGPIPTTFSFTPSKNYALKGKAEETGAHEEFDKAFEAKLHVFHDKALFTQRIAVTSSQPFTIPFTVEYMSCNDMMCLPPKTATLQVRVQK